MGSSTSTGGLSTGNFPGAMTTMSQQDNVQVTGETSFGQLPHTLQQKIWEIHRLVTEHRRHADTVSRFSTQDYGLDQHTKVRERKGKGTGTPSLSLLTPPFPDATTTLQKLKLNILRVQNSHSEISLAAGELRKQVERLRSYIHKIQVMNDPMADLMDG